MNRIIDRIISFVLRKTNPTKWARHLGVIVGESTMISSYCNFSGEPFLIKIGNHVQITNNVSIYTHGGGHVVRKEHPTFDFFGKVIIEDWVYVGAFSQILPGVTIGEGALVASGSVVTKSVAPYSVVAGNPARFICTTDEFYQKNKKYDVKTYNLSNKEKKEYLLKLSDDSFLKK